MKKALGLLLVGMFLVSLGAVPAFQGKYVKAQSLAGAKVIVEVRSEDGKPVLEVGKANTIIVKVLDRYGNPIKGVDVRIGFSFTPHGQVQSTEQLMPHGDYYIISKSPRIIGKLYLHVFIGRNEKLVTSIIAWKSGFPIPPDGWGVIPDKVVPCVLVNNVKYNVYLMGNPSTSQLTWLVLDQKGMIPDYNIYKKAAEAATIALFFNSSLMQNILDISVDSGLTAMLLEEIEEAKILKNFALLILSAGVASSRKFAEIYYKELHSYPAKHVLGTMMIHSPIAKKLAADEAREIANSEWGKEIAKGTIEHVYENTLLNVPSAVLDDYTVDLITVSLVSPLAEAVNASTNNLFKIVLMPDMPMEYKIAVSSMNLAADHLSRAYVVWAIKNRVSLSELYSEVDNSADKAYSKLPFYMKLPVIGNLNSLRLKTLLHDRYDYWYSEYLSTSKDPINFDIKTLAVSPGPWSYSEADDLFTNFQLGSDYALIGTYMSEAYAEKEQELGPIIFNSFTDIVGTYIGGVAGAVTTIAQFSVELANEKSFREAIMEHRDMIQAINKQHEALGVITSMWTTNLELVYPYLTSQNHLVISQAYLDKGSYEPGETATLTVKVVDSNGNPVDAKVTFYVYTGPGSRTPVEMDKVGEGTYQKTFQVPEEPMMYNVYVTAENPVYGKSFATLSFTVTKATLVEPTSQKPAYVGSPDNPRPFYIKLSTGVSYIDVSKLLKRVWIDHRINPKFEYLGTDSNGYAIYKVYTPSMNTEGKYDLTIELYNGLEITEKDAVVYGSSNDIDIVLVIDSSGSMHTYDGYWKGSDDNDLRLKAAKMLVDSMDKGDGVAVVDFDRSVRYYPPNERPLYISSTEDRNKLKSFIDTIDAWGGTYIGVGLKAAYDILSNARDNYPKYVMLLTDGDDNPGDPYDPIKVADWFRDKGWKVYTIGLTSGWYTSENRPFLNSDLLMKIADITGGKYYEAKKAEVLLEIYNTIKGIVKNRNTISSKSIELKPGKSTTQSVLIDPTVKAGEFSIAWSGSEFNLTLIAPDGSIITPEIAQSDPNITYIKGDTYVIYEVKNPLPGEWKMNITAVAVPKSGEDVTAMVLADTNLTIDLFTEKNTYKLGEPIKLIGVLTRNGEPVQGNVNATIVRPDGSVEYLKLLDDNNGGIYETYYMPKEAGSYTITLQASGNINGVPFTRQTTFSVYVSQEQVQAGFNASIDKFDFSTVSGKTLSLDFTINSTVQDIARIGITSLSNGTSTIAVNYTSSPEVLSILPDKNVPIHIDLTVPFNAKPGRYQGEIVIQGSNSVLTIPLELEIKPRLLQAPEDVGLYSTDINVDSIEVYEISKDTLKQITGDVPEVKNLRAFVITSTGFGHFKLRISNISNINNIKVLGYDFENKEWRQMSFEAGSVILPLSVNGFNVKLIAIGLPSTTRPQENSLNSIFTISYVWSYWFFKYYDEFNVLYKNATSLNVDNGTLQEALKLHNNATTLIKHAWRTDDLEAIKTTLRKKIKRFPRFWEIRKAYLQEMEAVKILKEAIEKAS
ncbi:VWA domain-containing protein [Thermococcus sp.]